MNEILVGILAFFILIVIAILRAILTQPDTKQSDRSPRRTPQQRRNPPRQPKARRVSQEPSPIQPDISETEVPYFSKRPPQIPASVPSPFNYQAEWWKQYSAWYREQRNWTCEACQLSLNDNRYYLHTHHVWGTHYNDPKDLMALCIGCHSEQPGGSHRQLKETPEYQGFMEKYGKEWRLRRHAEPFIANDKRK